MAALLDHVASGRSADSRPPNARELAATAVLALDLVEVSAKVRDGGPVDDEQDTALPHWAGVVPLTLTAGTPCPPTTWTRLCRCRITSRRIVDEWPTTPMLLEWLAQAEKSPRAPIESSN